MARRVAVLSGHLGAEAGDLRVGDNLSNPTSAAVDTKELYHWVVRDNREMREAIFEFLKVGAY